MADVAVDDLGLPQRVPPLGNIHDDLVDENEPVPEMETVEEFAVDEPGAEEAGATDVDLAENGHEADAVEPELVSRGIYFVRVPRPPIDETIVKKLRDEFNAHLTKVKGINQKLSTKRGEVNELKRQLGVARSLKEGSSPEYDEKITRLTELRKLRSQYLTQINAIKGGVKGLACRSEEELDDKIREFERQLQHDALPLREEKQIVGAISRLQSQREKIREYDQNKAALAELESECNKVKAVIAEIDSEFDILRGERSQAQEIIDELKKKLEVASTALRELQQEQEDCSKRMNDCRERIDKARQNNDNTMGDYSINRKFSSMIRDLVAEGRVEEARAECVQQMEAMMAKLTTDAAYRAEYYKLWSQQRKYAVSELLPQASPVQMAPAQTGKGASAAPKPQGAQKAHAILAAVLQETNRELQARARGAEAAENGHADDEDEHSLPIQIPKAATPTPLKSKPKASAVVDYKQVIADLPQKAYDDDFVPPVVPKQQTQDEDLKERVREENRLKAKEAEQRKQRRLDAAARRRAKAADLAASKKAAAADRAAKHLESEPEAEGQTATEEEVSAAEPTSEVDQTVHHRPTKFNEKPAVKPPKVRDPPRVRRPKPKDSALVKLWKEHRDNITIAAVICVVLLLVVLALWLSR